MVRLIVREGEGGSGGGSASSALTVSKCENFNPFFSLKFDYFILKAHFISFKEGSQNAFFMPFSWLQMIIRRERPLAIDNPEGPASCKRTSRKLPFPSVKSVSEHICSLSGVKKQKKITKSWPQNGGGAYSQPDCKISFFTTSLQDSFRKKTSMMLNKI